MTLFWDQTGPLIKYSSGALVIEDLNPENSICFRMSRWELIRLGLWCLLGAIWK